MRHAPQYRFLVALACIWFAGLERSSSAAQDWVAFKPPSEELSNSLIDLRFLNELYAGQQGWIVAKEGQFFHSENGEKVRFWAVNGPPHDLTGNDLKRCAKLLACYGVNLVRIHSAVFDERGEVDQKKIAHIQEIVRVMKTEGIYSHLSIYFPLWFKPPKDLSWLPGYDGNTHPFAALMFHPEFQSRYRQWYQTLLTTPDPATGKSLLEEPALFGVEIQNEDSFFFWTFNEQSIPDPILKVLEKDFGRWLTERYGSSEAAFKKWNGLTLPRDQSEQDLVAFRPLWNIANQRHPRDLDTARFLYEKQSQFYQSTCDYLRQLGFRGLITASNWATASPERLGPLEKMSYTIGDFVDRHGYFECNHKGENAAWSVRNGHTYMDRSALRFDPNTPGKPKEFVHPVMDPQYDEKPSMISETTFTRPNRYRSEAPFFFACYGALQDTDAIVHFAFDGQNWNVKPNYFMQQWTLATPSMMGQFPAAALLYRKGLVATAPIVADVRLNREDLLQLKGTPLPQDASLDELRAKDLPPVAQANADHRIDPLLHFVGRTRVTFTDKPGSASVQSEYFPFKRGKNNNSTKGVIQSATKELALDYETGLLTINSPKAQGLVGDLRSGKRAELADIKIDSTLDLGSIVLVSLDDQPMVSSKKMLLQVMSEEKASNFKTEDLKDGTRRILEIGTDPWLIRPLSGTVELRWKGSKNLRVTALDHEGRFKKSKGKGPTIKLESETMYYLIE